MTDREVKRLLKAACSLPETERGAAFVRRHERRSLSVLRLLQLEAPYLGLQGALTGLALCLLFLFLSQEEHVDAAWTLSALVPVCALGPGLLLSRSERYGMAELEAASRFSLRSLRLIRMLILGICSTVLLLGLRLILQLTLPAAGTDYLRFVLLPYLVSCYGALLVARKRHGQESTFGVLAVCVSCVLLPFALRALHAAGRLPPPLPALLVCLFLAALLREAVLYLRESENLSWSLS